MCFIFIIADKNEILVEFNNLSPVTGVFFIVHRHFGTDFFLFFFLL